MYEVEKAAEKTMLISVNVKGTNREEAKEHLEELAFLVKTAGADVVYKVYQELPKLNHATCIGSGKIKEIKEIIEEKEITLVVFDDDLTPMQNRNLVRELNVKVLDRSGIILDIFASRAKTQEAKLQVELAQLQYLLPRLTRLWTHLSKQFGGIGSLRGPGETQIETDRRLIRERIQIFKEKIKDIEIQKTQQRKGRDNFPRFALIGYTNAGKSTLMKTITNEAVYIEDQLFATLDTTVRAFELPSGTVALLSDTVGFIRKLPTHLIASFRSTLAEAREADILVHVIDISHPSFREQIKAVEETLDYLKISDKPTIMVFNKIDLLEDMEITTAIAKEYPNSVFIGAKRGINIFNLLTVFQTLADKNCSELQLFIPYSDTQVLGKIYDKFEIIERNDEDDGTRLLIKVKEELLNYFNNYFSNYIIKK